MTNRTQQQQNTAEQQAAAAERERAEREAAERGDNATDADREAEQKSKVFLILARTADGQEHFQIRTADNADGLELGAMHTYGLPEEDVTVYELHTV